MDTQPSNQKPIVVHLLPNLDPGGCESQLLKILPHTKNFRHVMLTIGQEGVLAEGFRQQGIEVISLGINNPLLIWKYDKLIKTIKKIKPNLILTYLFIPDILGPLVIRPLTGYRPIPYLRAAYLFNNWRARVIHLLEWLTQPFIERFLANSRAVKQAYIKQGVPSKKITVITNCVKSPIGASRGDLSALRQELGLPNGARIICCVANLHVYKGHRYLIEAFARIAPNYPRAFVLLIGVGSEDENIRQQIEKLLLRQRVLLLGRRSDVAKILQISDIFVLPTFTEGLSNAVMEAMANGLPCITTNILPNRELIVDSKNGYLVPVADSQAVEEKLVKLLDDESLRHQLGQAAKKEMAKYQPAVIAKQLEQYLSKAAKISSRVSGK